MSRPKLLNVKPLEGYKLQLDYDSGECRVYDCVVLLDSPIFQPLKNMAIFSTVRKIRIDSGVEFVGGLDICPDDLYYNSTIVTHADPYS